MKTCYFVIFLAAQLFASINSLHLSDLTRARAEMKKAVDMMKNQNQNENKGRILSITSKKDSRKLRLNKGGEDKPKKDVFIHQDRYLKPVKPRKLLSKRGKKHKKKAHKKVHKKAHKKAHKKHHKKHHRNLKDNGRNLRQTGKDKIVVEYEPIEKSHKKKNKALKKSAEKFFHNERKLKQKKMVNKKRNKVSKKKNKGSPKERKLYQAPKESANEYYNKIMRGYV